MLRRRFGCTEVRDEGDYGGRMALTSGALHLMCTPPTSVPDGALVIAFDQAMRDVRC